MDDTKLSSVSEGVIKILNKLKGVHLGELSKEEAQEQIVDDIIDTIAGIASKVAETSANKGIAGDIISNVTSILKGSLSSNADEHGTISGISGSIRNFINNAVVSISSKIGLEKIGKILTSDLATLLSKREKTPFVDAVSNIGKFIGGKIPFPGADVLGEQIAGIIAMTAELAFENIGINYSHKQLLMETEFSQKNLQLLQDFGIKQEQIALITEKFVEKRMELDKEFIEKVAKNEQVKKDMLDAFDKI